MLNQEKNAIINQQLITAKSRLKMNLLRTIATFILSFIGLLPPGEKAVEVDSKTPAPTAQKEIQEVQEDNSQEKNSVKGESVTVELEKNKTPSPTEKPTQETQEQNQNTSSFKYPNSKTSFSGENEDHYQTTDDPEAVTEWYKSKIKNDDLNVRSFVQTTVNNETENVLVGANSEQEIRIEIIKKAEDEQTKIVVKFD